MNKKISIIVPIYNSEKYLKKCIDSLTKQSLKDIEIILINDGSTDNSLNICMEYMSDDRVIIIDKANSGLADTRNIGLKRATGEYIMFVDSDDYINLNSCELFYNIALENKLDVLTANYIKETENNCSNVNKNKELENKILNGKDYLKQIILHNCDQMMVCLNLYNREFLIKNNLFFIKNRIHEDERWTPLVFLNANRVMYTNSNFYHYVYNSSSITNDSNKQLRNAIDTFKNCIELKQIYSSLEDEELKKLLYDNLVVQYLNSFYVAKMNQKDKLKYLKDEFLNEEPYKKRTKRKLKLYKMNRNLYFNINYAYKLFNKTMYAKRK